jgi:hypothetical protein
MTPAQISIIETTNKDQQIVFWKHEAMGWQARCKRAEDVLVSIAIAKSTVMLMRLFDGQPMKGESDETSTGGDVKS